MTADAVSSSLESGQRRALVLLSPHRCGSSAATRVLNLCGVSLPRHLVDPKYGRDGDSNRDKGFWESAPLLSLNNEILASVGASWDSVDAIDPHWFDSKGAAEWVSRLAEVLAEELLDQSLTVVKDPRVCRLVPLWRRALESLSIEPLWIHLIRNPLESADSLERRDGFPLAKGLLMWLRHFAAAEQDSRGGRRAFVTYDTLLDDWRVFVGQVSRQLMVDIELAGPSRETEVETFVEPSLRHCVSTLAELDACVDADPAVAELYRWALRAAENSCDVGQSGAGQVATASSGGRIAELSLALAESNRWIAKELESSTRRHEDLASYKRALVSSLVHHRKELDCVETKRNEEWALYLESERTLVEAETDQNSEALAIRLEAYQKGVESSCESQDKAGDFLEHELWTLSRQLEVVEAVESLYEEEEASTRLPVAFRAADEEE